MAQVIYCDNAYRSEYGELPIIYRNDNEKNKHLMENTFAYIYGNDVSKHIPYYDLNGAGMLPIREVIARMQRTCIMGGKSDYLTVWNDIYMLDKKEYMKKGGSSQLQNIAHALTLSNNFNGREKFQATYATKKLPGDNRAIIIVTMCTMGCNLYTNLNISDNVLFRKRESVVNAIYRFTGNTVKVFFDRPDTRTLFTYEEFQYMEPAITFL